MIALTTEKLPKHSELEDYSKRARLIYEKLKDELEQRHWGEYAVINPDDGNYFVGPDRSEILSQAKLKYPDILLFSHRMRYRASFHFGGRGVNDGKKL
ncbi:MAG: hypothetical protein JSW07_22670 [bacterium]|nr:MAG: hypothetical protein JSW07_22670 [bacterium]